MEGLDHKAIAEAIKAHKHELLPEVREEVRKALTTLSPEKALTFRLMRDDTEVRVLPPSVSKDYAGALFRFCRTQQYQGYPVDSAVTPIVMAAVEKTILSFFQSKELSADIAEAVLGQFKEAKSSDVLREELADEASWIRHELATLANLNVATSVAGQLVDATAQQVHHFFQTAVGKSILLAIGKVLATSSGKLLLMRTVQAAVAKVMASAALKSALITTIKKIGIGILIKTAIGKMLIVLLAAVGLAKVPVFWIILPLIGAFLVYEYKTFPDKLATRIPDEVVKIVDSQFGELSDKMAESILAPLVATIISELTRVRTESVA